MKNKDDSTFFTEDIIFEDHWRQVAVERIYEIICDFPGKKEFTDFYLAHNGGVFTEHSLLYTDDLFADPCDYRLLEVESFLHIPLPDDGDAESFTYSIEKEIKRRIGHSGEYDNFVLSHIPFANDAGDNTYWIDTKTGKIKFAEYDYVGYDPDGAITVAHSFSDFCTRLRVWQ